MTTIRTRITAILLCVLLLCGAAPAGVFAFAEDTPDHEHVSDYWEYEDDDYHSGTCTVCGNFVYMKHEWIEDTKLYIAPTETKEGFRYYQCKQCREQKVETIDKLPHTEHDYDGVYYEPTCTEDGYWEFTCSICGGSYTESVPGTKLGHDWDDGTVEEEPTCTKAGKRIYVCRNNYTHTYEEPIPASGHAFGEWKMTTAPTDTADGVETRVCSACGVTETRTVKRLTLDQKDVVLRYNTSVTLKASLDDVTWTSSNEKVIKVDKTTGKLTTVRRGTAVVTAHSADGTQTAKCKVTVKYEWWQWIIIIFLLGWIWYLK